LQVEQVERDTLHAMIDALPADDPRRESWFSVDQLSASFFPAWPTEASAIDGQLFAEAFTTLLGLPSPVLSPYVGLSIPCGRAGSVPCDAYGRQLGLATLPGGSWTDCHDACGGELFSIVRESGVSVELEPRSIFHTLIPPVALLARDRPAIVPDASAHVSLPRVATQRGDAQAGAPLPARVLLFDVKTTYGGSQWYTCARGVQDQSGAVAGRAHRVITEYRQHAARLDRRYSPVDAQGVQTTPIADRLASFTAPRALVFGQYCEASTDVHALLDLAATASAQARWRLLGARNMQEARGYIITAYRRRLALASAREFARHRLHRVPYVGVPRAAIAQHRVVHGAPGLGGGGPVAHQIRSTDFFAHQRQLFHARVVRVGA
jgi:hypothetical protein